jgi:hypothetical protein
MAAHWNSSNYRVIPSCSLYEIFHIDFPLTMQHSTGRKWIKKFLTEKFRTFDRSFPSEKLQRNLSSFLLALIQVSPSFSLQKKANFQFFFH